MVNQIWGIEFKKRAGGSETTFHDASDKREERTKIGVGTTMAWPNPQ